MPLAGLEIILSTSMREHKHAEHAHHACAQPCSKYPCSAVLVLKRVQNNALENSDQTVLEHAEHAQT